MWLCHCPFNNINYDLCLSVQGHVPVDNNLLDYVSRPPPPSHRIYCTLIPSSSSSPPSSSSQRSSRHPSQYTLYVEHLGTLIPILEATRRNSKIRPSFTISLPSSSFLSTTENLPPSSRSPPEAPPHESNLELGENSGGTHSPLRCVNADNNHPDTHNSLNTESGGIQLACREDEGETPRSVNRSTSDGNSSHSDTVISSRHLAEVSSHIIASKFRIQSINPLLPLDQGTIIIKTSFLHIQPRKVIVHLPAVEEDSGIDSETEDSHEETGSGRREVFRDADVSLDSLSSLEELRDTASPPRANESSTGNKNNVSAVTSVSNANNLTSSPSTSSTSDSPVVIHSKTPTWNEQHMIYQLDFGGRVTTKSAKNFQLEMGSEQVGLVCIN